MSDALERICPDGDWRLSPPQSGSRKCDIYIVTNTSAAQKLALKVYREDAVSEQAPGLQFRALDRLQKAEPRIAAPAVFSFSAEHRAILMEWIDAETIQKVLWRWTLLPAKRQEAVKKTGKWLRRFHEVSHIAMQPIDGEKLAQKLATQLSKHKHTPHFEAIQHCIKKFEAAAQATGPDVPHALLHGDFTIRNVLMQDEAPIGVDIWGARMGPVFEDAARFITYTAVNSPFSLSAAPWHPDGVLSQSFAAGYGKDLLDVRSRSWILVLWYQFIRRWIVYSARSSAGSFAALNGWQAKRAATGARSLQSWLEDCF